ncbi:creatininase family protein [Sporosalibacterium faouarense]|uniref:creatininase family protein n=1 Tax=Sporosalibacterium faouarense TaxID=516123 RepID=UPI001FAF6292|nr:creatininase family protein [Sporosalibacterium faouarense]
MKQTNEILYMTRDDVQERITEFPVAILPLGATEQHGHHMPLGVDTILAHELSKKVADKTGALVLPPMPFGYSWVWRDIAGTISLQQHHVEMIIKDVAHSVERYGIKLLVVINGHDANKASMKYAVRELVDESDLKVIYLFYPEMDEVLDELMETPTWHGMIHACEFETSLMLAVKPDLVDMDKAVKEYPTKDNLYGKSSMSLGNISKSGVFGNSTKATKEKGQKLLKIFVDKMVANIMQAYKEI